MASVPPEHNCKPCFASRASGKPFTPNTIPMKTTMYILELYGAQLAFKSMSAATAAMTALSKGIEIDHDSDYKDYIITPEENQRFHSRMKLSSGKVAQPKKQRPLGLPAPKRNTIECPFCESVSVVRGSNCQSCGEYVS